ncbi:MAG: alpha/beta fold hydrolase [Lachnospiraceae bacterium]|jgi:pimeloyl-ACP methyl ester carboxylesterase|nr:alpha/beta fold hydrolase [Lachnospiraceae bacterium]
MKTVLLHGLGQTAQDWDTVIQQASLKEIDSPELFTVPEGNLTYSAILAGLEKRYEDDKEPFCICGLSLGAMLALDYTIRHKNKVSSLVLIGAQYKSPRLLIDFQNLIFRCMPQKVFEGIGLTKYEMIRLSHSMRSLDFTSGLKDIRCPVAIICGEKDHANLKAANQFKQLLPQAKLHIIPGAGHEINKTAPEAISAVLRSLNME